MRFQALSAAVMLCACAPAEPPPFYEETDDDTPPEPASPPPSPAPFVFAYDGVVADDPLALVHADAAPLTISLALRNVSEEELVLLSDPPLLVGGADAALFSIPAQPAARIAPATAAPFDVVYTPRSGTRSMALLFAYGVGANDRGRLTVRVAGPERTPGVRYAIYDGTFDVLPDFSGLTPAETGVLASFDVSARVDDDLFAACSRARSTCRARGAGPSSRRRTTARGC